MPPMVARPRREIDYMCITSAEGIIGENQRSSYHKLFKRNVLAIRYPDNSTLRDLGLFDNVNWMLGNLGGSCTTCTVYFRMFNRDYTYSQDQMANIFSFPHGDEYTCQAPLEREWESSALDFWRQLIGKTTTDWEGLKAIIIQNPTIRYLHRILASTIFGRENTGNSTSVRIRGPICVGGLITSIALTLDLSTKLATLDPLETPFANLDYFCNMRLIKNKPDDKYYLMISNREVRGVTLPCIAHINVRLSTNWIFYANAPDPDDNVRPDRMEEDTPQNGTHAHTTHAFSDSSTGTSFGYQPREEYDYTAIRITLDDILSELRHQNDIDVESDVLFKSIQRKQEEMRVTIDQIRENQLDFVERTKLNMGDLIEKMNEVRREVSDMREYMQHVPHLVYGRSGIRRHRGRDRHH
ncbi:hypothetical protein KIW84_012664 [Lathyrus oleraceus]|uniref:Arabidopsis retrotransposon Orf1 C-terminal domain-containing protein n=1 Tax=Pisum sativum TaxID=3888 RepID=A0A9D5BI36_PEA|nr:hypothetical protein KIW84_012664 [Pisum sativum]